MPSEKLIPVSEPSIGQAEIAKVLECIQSGWVSSEGPYIKEFEEKCAASVGMKYGVAVCNATAALHVALQCLRLEKGSEVILPSFTIISCATAVIEAGLVPVLVDCDPETWTMDVEQVRERITPRTRAIMVVHIYGHPVDMAPIQKVAHEHDLRVIEDNAEAHGAEYSGKKCGSLGDISVLSFYANKLVTTGEGGMVLCNDEQHAERARGLRNLCFLPEQRFLHREIGHNYRMTSLQAALGTAQLTRLPEFVKRRREMAKMYNEAFMDLPLQLPTEKPWAKNIYWMYGVVLEDSVGFDARVFAARLSGKAVQTRPFFLGMHEQPVFHEMGLFRGLKLPVCERIARRGLYLPSGQAITDDQIRRVADAVRAVLGAS